MKNCSNCYFFEKKRFNDDGFGWCNIVLPPKYHIEHNYEVECTFICDLHKPDEAEPIKND